MVIPKRRVIDYLRVKRFRETAETRRTLDSRKRWVDPADFSCSSAHSRRMAPRLPRERCSWPANWTNSSRRFGRIRTVTHAFHSPMDYPYLPFAEPENKRINVSFVSLLRGWTAFSSVDLPKIPGIRLTEETSVRHNHPRTICTVRTIELLRVSTGGGWAR